MDIERARQLAKDETTPPETLRELATSEDRRTRKSVAKNPNTPIKTLFTLGAQFPKQFLNNPIFDLLLLENPNLIKDIPIKTLRSLVRLNNIPESFIIERAERESEKSSLLAMTMNSKLSRSVLEKLCQSKFTEVSEAAKLHINWSGEIKEGWEEFAEEIIRNTNFVFNVYKYKYYLSTIVKLCPKAILPIFFHSENSLARAALARSEKIQYLSDNSLQKLVSDRDINCRVCTARNSLTPPNILNNLANDIPDYIRQHVASNPNTPINALERLAFDKEESVRKAVAENSNTSWKLLEQLAIDKSWSVRRKVAQNPITPVAILDKIATDKSLRSYCNPKRNKELRLQTAYAIEQRSLQEKPKHQKIAEEKDFLLKSVSKETRVTLTRLILLFDRNADINFLTRYCNSIFWSERYAIAQNEKTPFPVIQRLAKDANRIVRAAAKARLETKP